ncbi:hypothetical protein GCM10028810_35880 [Spirosoma litoris]
MGEKWGGDASNVSTVTVVNEAGVVVPLVGVVDDTPPVQEQLVVDVGVVVFVGGIIFPTCAG